MMENKDFHRMIDSLVEKQDERNINNCKDWLDVNPHQLPKEVVEARIGYIKRALEKILNMK